MKNEVRDYIKNNFETNSPILSRDIKLRFSLFKAGTIRQILCRFVDEGWLNRIVPGVFFMPEQKGVFGKAFVMPEQVVQKKYLENEEGIIGYTAGWSFANELCLTTQTSPVIEVVSNIVSDKKRRIVINKRRVTLKKARVKVDNNNWKLLQVLDILLKFEWYSEESIDVAKNTILQYLRDIPLSSQQIRDIVAKYPVKAQLNFYKMGELVR